MDAKYYINSEENLSEELNRVILDDEKARDFQQNDIYSKNSRKRTKNQIRAKIYGNAFVEPILIKPEVSKICLFFADQIKKRLLVPKDIYQIYRSAELTRAERLVHYLKDSSPPRETKVFSLDYKDNKFGTASRLKKAVINGILSSILAVFLFLFPLFSATKSNCNYVKLLTLHNLFSQEKMYASTKTSLYGEDLPKVSASNPSWYSLENQPLEAIIQNIEKTDIRLDIGKTLATINSANYTLDAAPYIKNSRTMVPVRFITEGLGANVGWEGTEKKVTINYEGKTIELWIGKTNAKVDGSKYTLDATPEIKNSRTFVPIRFIAENFGSQVGWNGTLKEVSIYKEKVSKSINYNSDADRDGVTFSKEKAIGTNPNSKNTVYNSLDDKALSELLSEYPGLNIFAKYPDGKTGLTLSDKAKLGLNPTNAFNIDEILNDQIAIEYAMTKNLADSKENIAKAVASITENYGAKLGAAVKQAAAGGSISPEEIDSSASTAKIQVEAMFSERAYKTKADGSSITLEELTSIPRYKALIILNKEFGQDNINILLSQSSELQNSQNIGQYEDLIKTLQAASNTFEETAGQKINELDVFKKYINQWGLFDNNAGEYAVQIWKNASDKLKEEIMQHPKLFLAYLGKNRAWVEAGKIKIGDKEYDFSGVFNDIVKYSMDQLDYIAKKEKYFQEKGYELYEYSGYGRQIENLPFIWMQGFMAPGQRFLEISQDKLSKGTATLRDVVADLMDISDYDDLLKIFEEKYQNVPIGSRGCVSNFLGPGLGPAAYGSKPATAAMWIDIKIRGPPERWLADYEKDDAIPEALLPYGQIITEKMVHLNLNQREVSQKLITLLAKNNPTEPERIPWYKIEDAMAVEKILDNVMIMPTIEQKFDVDKTELCNIVEKNKFTDVTKINRSIMQGGRIEDYGAKKDYLPMYFAVPYESSPNDPLNILLKEKNVKKGEAVWWNISFLY